MQPILDKEKDNLFGAFVSQLRTIDFSENTFSTIIILTTLHQNDQFAEKRHGAVNGEIKIT